MIGHSNELVVKISEGLFEFTFEDFESRLGSGFFSFVFSKGGGDGVVDGLNSSSNSFNGSFIKEHIEFRSSHLSEHSNNRGHSSGLVNFER